MLNLPSVFFFVSLEHVASSPVARHVFLYYLLSRLQQQDIQQSGALLSCLPHIEVGGVNLWKGEAAQGEQSFLHGVLRTAASLIITVKVGVAHSNGFDDLISDVRAGSCGMLTSALPCFALRLLSDSGCFAVAERAQD